MLLIATPAAPLKTPTATLYLPISQPSKHYPMPAGENCRPDSSLLVITIPTTPPRRSHGDPTRPPRTPGPLKSAFEEARAIMRAAAGKSSVVQCNQPSAEYIMRELSGFQAVHLACHGVSDSKSPSRSRLLLNDGTGMLDNPTVERLLTANMENAQIAYLSACCSQKAPRQILERAHQVGVLYSYGRLSAICRGGGPLVTLLLSRSPDCFHLSLFPTVIALHVALLEYACLHLFFFPAL